MLRLLALPATPDQLARVRSDPTAAGPALDPHADADAHRLRHGPAVRLREVWPLVHGLFVRADGPLFLVQGGERVGERARAFGSAEVGALADAVERVRDPGDGFEPAEGQAAGAWFVAAGDVRPEAGMPVARERLAEVQALVRTAADEGLGLLVIGGGADKGADLDLHVATDAAIARYRGSPELLEAQRSSGPPSGAVAVRGWYPLHVALTELGDTEVHGFVAGGGDLVDEALQLRVFDPDAVAALGALLGSIEVAALLAALPREVVDREELDADEVDTLGVDYPPFRAAVVDWAADRLGMVTILG